MPGDIICDTLWCFLRKGERKTGNRSVWCNSAIEGNLLFNLLFNLFQIQIQSELNTEMDKTKDGLGITKPTL